jgi:hypothetical protein
MPNPDQPPHVARGSTKVRSQESREKRDLDLLERRLSKTMQNASTMKVPFALEDMTEEMFSEPLEDICDRIEGYDSQCFSTRIVDENDQTIVFYFGYEHPNPRKVRLVRIFLFRLNHSKVRGRKLNSTINTKIGRKNIWNVFRRRTPASNLRQMVCW